MKNLPPFLLRMKSEWQELYDKVFKLKGFIENTDNMKKVDATQWVLLVEQYVYMTNYLRILETRIKLAEEAL